MHRWTAALQVAIAVPFIVLSGIALDRVRATATGNLGFESDLLYAAPLKFMVSRIRVSSRGAEAPATISTAMDSESVGTTRRCQQPVAEIVSDTEAGSPSA